MQISKRFRWVSTPGKSACRASCPKALVLFSSTGQFLARLLEKYARSLRFPGSLARIFLLPRQPLALRRFHSSVKIHISPQFVSNGFFTLAASSGDEATRNRRSPQILARWNDRAQARNAAPPAIRVFAGVAGPVHSARMSDSNPPSVISVSSVCPVTRVLLRTARPINETEVSTEVGKEERRPAEKQIQQSRVAAPYFGPQQITHLTDQVLKAIDRRIVAERERWGRL